jgi:hypothetical protein
MKMRFTLIFVLLSGCVSGAASVTSYHSSSKDGSGLNGISRNQAFTECKWEAGMSSVTRKDQGAYGFIKEGPTGVLTRDDCMLSKGFHKSK